MCWVSLILQPLPLKMSIYCCYFLKLKQIICFFLKAGPADLRHFDPEFTQETVPSSIIQTPDLATSSSSATDAFLGFSYAPNDED